MWCVRDKEYGDAIQFFKTKEEAEHAIEDFEKEDKENDEFTPDFYEVHEIERTFDCVNRGESGFTEFNEGFFEKQCRTSGTSIILRYVYDPFHDILYRYIYHPNNLYDLHRFYKYYNKLIRRNNR